MAARRPALLLAEAEVDARPSLKALLAANGVSEHKKSVNELPRLLPAPPVLPPVALDSLELDEALRDVPVSYILASLRQLGPRMLATVEANSPILTSPVVNLPTPTATTSTCSQPTHQLSITFEDSLQPLLLPVHGLLWAFTSPLLSSISSGASEGPPFPITLPSASSFHLLHTWIYLECPHPVLHPLVGFSDEGEASKASPSRIVELCALQKSGALLDRLELLSGLYRNVVALQVGDQNLWSAMRGAWQILVNAIELSRGRTIDGCRV